MADNKDYMIHPEELGCIHISEEVLGAIAGGAAVEIEGISGMMNVTGKKTSARGVRVAVDEAGVTVDLYVMIRYGFAIPEVSEKLQTAVAAALEAMTGFAVKAVNVHVGGVSFQ